MVDIRRFRSCHWILHKQRCTCDYHRWHSVGGTNLQDWPTLPMAFWSRSRKHKLTQRMSAHSAEHSLVHFWWTMVLDMSYILRHPALHHNHRNPFRKAAFQAGQILAVPFRLPHFITHGSQPALLFHHKHHHH